VAVQLLFREEGLIDGRTGLLYLADQEAGLLAGKIRPEAGIRGSEMTTRLLFLDPAVIFRPARGGIPNVERRRQKTSSNTFAKEYALDAWWIRGCPDDPERDVPNPKRAELTVKLAGEKVEFDGLPRSRS